MKQEQTGAVIVEVRGRKAAALTERGEFLRVNNIGYTVGQQVLLTPQPEAALPARRRAHRSVYAGIVAGLLLLVLGGFKGYTLPVGVVSLDVNPSIEYTINCFDCVLDISAVNDDGDRILAGMDEAALRFRPVDEAVDATILALRENGYFSDIAENDVVIAASSYEAGHTQRIAERLGARVERQGDLTVFSVPVTKHEVSSAHALGTSAGKLYIVEKLGDSWCAAESIDADDWIMRPVREIIRETKEQREGKEHNDWPTDSSSGASSSGTDADSGESRKSDSSTEEQKSTDPYRKGEEKEDSREP